MQKDMKIWLRNFTDRITAAFGKRVVLIGLQGSYGRGEATESSDIDVVVILDQVTVEDLERYDAAISQLPYREKMCGFISGKNELLHWEKSDLFQFYYDTKKIIGDIDFLLPLLKKEDIRRAVLIGACNIYHMTGHNFCHEKEPGILKALCKSAVFVLQAKHFCDTGVYIEKKADLLSLLSAQDKEILDLYYLSKTWSSLNREEHKAFSNTLLRWSSQLINDYAIS